MSFIVRAAADTARIGTLAKLFKLMPVAVQETDFVQEV